MKPKLPAARIETPITVATPVKQTIGQIHSELWDKGILTKSMVNTFYKCPIQLERRHVYGEKSPPGFVTSMGQVYAYVNEQAGLRHLMGSHLSDAEAESIVHEKWAKEMAEVTDPEAKDLMLAVEKKARILQSVALWWAQWKMEWRAQTGDLVGVEAGFGYDGSIEVTDSKGTKVKLASTMDRVFEEAVADDKFVGQSSSYRNANSFTYEMGHLAIVTGKRKAFFFPAIHDLKKGPSVEKIDCPQTDATIHVAIEKAGAARRAIDAGLFHPPTVRPGEFPCHPEWCGYFGRTCPVTKHLSREPFLAERAAKKAAKKK